MIVSASYRTDIPAFYGEWFRHRLAAGWCRVANPYGGPPAIVTLRPSEVDGFVFWSRNPAPFAPALAAVHALRVPFVLTVTVIGYPRGLDRAVPAPDRVVETVHGIAARYGPRAVVWRYDPILLTVRTQPDWHRQRFAELAAALAGAVDEVVVSFATPYAKTRYNLARAVRADQTLAWRLPDEAEAESLCLTSPARPPAAASCRGSARSRSG